jgi:pimeloyl-ACP methyl ester carboxylesterase
MPCTDVNDTTIYFEREGAGPSVLFVHGQFGDADIWADQARRLSGRFSCVRYDRRGHRHSARGTAVLSDVVHAQDAVALIEALDLAPCLLVGSSRGAAIAVEAAVQRGELLRGVVLSEPPLFSIDADAADRLLRDVIPAVEQAQTRGGPSQAVDAFFRAVCPSFWASLGDEERRRFLANADIGLADLRSPGLDISTADLAGIDVPALVISGETSHRSLRSIAQQIAVALPDARFVELAGCGHVTHAERPDQFADALATFARELDRECRP